MPVTLEDEHQRPGALTQTREISRLGGMEVPFSPDEQARISQIASSAGRGVGEFVREVMTGYLDDVAEVREMLDTRYDDIKSGRVKPIDGEEVFARLCRKSEERRATRS